MNDRLHSLYNYREMIRCMVRRDLRGRYQGSALGFLWTLANPLLQLAVYSFVFTGILRSSIERYPLYLFIALIPWIFFSASATGGASCILAQKELVRKIWFPREVLPVAYVTVCFVNMLLCFVIILAAVWLSGIRPHPLGLLCLPAVMAAEYLLALGAALLASAVTVYFRDLEHILSIVMTAWMYLTPVVYSEEMIPPQYRWVFALNPMTSVIGCYRDILYSGTVPQISMLLACFLPGLALILLGWQSFGRLQRRFAEVL